jgi:hypothetical protein
VDVRIVANSLAEGVLDAASLNLAKLSGKIGYEILSPNEPIGEPGSWV